MGTQKNYLNHTQNKCLNQWIGMDSKFYVQNVGLSEPMLLINCSEYHVRIQRGDRGSGPPLKNHKNIGFLSNSGPDPLKNYEATEPAFNGGPSLAHKGNAI